MRRTSCDLTRPGKPRRAAALLGAALVGVCALLAAPPANAQAPLVAGHDREFWRALQRNQFAVPPGETAAGLLRQLSASLGSPVSEERELAATLAYVWIQRQKVLTPEELREHLAAWTTNLKTGIGESGTDSVLLRSFSALNLSILASLDAESPFLTPTERAALLDAALAYCRDEKDLRGYEPAKGWLHSAAHTADLLKALAAGKSLPREGQARILDAVAGKLVAPVYTWGEAERLAKAVAAVLERPDFDAAAFDAFLASLDREAQPLWKETPLDPARFAAVENGKGLLKSLHVLLAPSTDPRHEGAKAKILAALAAR